MSFVKSIYITTKLSKSILRKKKIRRILGLPEKNEFISPGIYTSEKD